MNCIKCKENEIQLENLCFYLKSDNTVHLMIKYEKIGTDLKLLLLNVAYLENN